MTIADLISPDITDPTVRSALVRHARRGLSENGVASIPAFLTDATVEASCAEALDLARVLVDAGDLMAEVGEAGP